MILLTISTSPAPWTSLQQLFSFGVAPGIGGSSNCISKKMIHTCYMKHAIQIEMQSSKKKTIGACTKKCNIYWLSASLLKQKRNKILPQA